MRRTRRYCAGACAALWFLTLTGCITLPLWPQAPPAPGGVPPSPAPPIPTDPVHLAGYAPAQPPEERVSLLIQQLAAAEDQKRVVTGRLQYLESQVDEKERAITTAAQQVGATTEEMTRLSQEVQRWKAEVTAARERVRALEQENRETLEMVVNVLQQAVERKPPVAPTVPPPSGPP